MGYSAILDSITGLSHPTYWCATVYNFDTTVNTIQVLTAACLLGSGNRSLGGAAVLVRRGESVN